MTTLRLYFNISLKGLSFVQIYFYIKFIGYRSPQNCSLTKYFEIPDLQIIILTLKIYALSIFIIYPPTKLRILRREQ